MTSLMHKEYTIVRDDFTNAGKVSSDIKRMLSQLGISTPVLRKIAIACYEAEINTIIHSYGGVATLDIDSENMIRITFKDSGPGIADIEKALSPGYSTASVQAREMGFGAGMGLPNIKRVSDEFSLESTQEGTQLTIGFREGI